MEIQEISSLGSVQENYEVVLRDAHKHQPHLRFFPFGLHESQNMSYSKESTALMGMVLFLSLRLVSIFSYCLFTGSTVERL